jgi:hypothetical protein
MQFDYFLHVLGYGAPTDELTNKLKNLRASNKHMVYDGPPYDGNGDEPTTDAIIVFVVGSGLGRTLWDVAGTIKAYLGGDKSRKIVLEREGKRIAITGDDK